MISVFLLFKRRYYKKLWAKKLYENKYYSKIRRESMLQSEISTIVLGLNEEDSQKQYLMHKMKSEKFCRINFLVEVILIAITPLPFYETFVYGGMQMSRS